MELNTYIRTQINEVLVNAVTLGNLEMTLQMTEVSPKRPYVALRDSIMRNGQIRRNNCLCSFPSEREETALK